jgi:nitroimidazol reductase NimA-like FMN-containing flavoprotein (pyridoxamine 5'-phosphate oxidase superfamily)
MWETQDEITTLQRLLDESFGRGSRHLAAIMTPARRLSAEQVLEALPSPAVLNIATVTARGEPRISAVDGHFLHGHWYFTTDAGSPKARQLRARPAISAAFTPRDGMGVFCHGRAVELPPGEERQMLIDHFVDTYGQSPEVWGDIFYARIDADWLVGFAMTPEEEREIEQQRIDREQRRAGTSQA